jgi:hypothetical protein
MKTLPFLRSCATECREIDKCSISVFSDPSRSLGSHSDVVAELVPRVHEVVRDSFRGDMRTRTPEKMRDRLLRADTLAILDDGNTVVGFAAGSDYSDIETFYLDSIVLLSEFQGRALADRSFYAITDGSVPFRTACTTQSPRVFRWLTKTFSKVFPSSDQPQAPQRLRRIANVLAKDRGVLNPATFVIRDLYDVCRYNNIPMSGVDKVNRWFTAALDIRNGETCHGFFFVGEGGRSTVQDEARQAR